MLTSENFLNKWERVPGPRDKASKNNNEDGEDENNYSSADEGEDYEETYGDLENGHDDLTNPEADPGNDIF